MQVCDNPIAKDNIFVKNAPSDFVIEWLLCNFAERYVRLNEI